LVLAIALSVAATSTPGTQAGIAPVVALAPVAVAPVPATPSSVLVLTPVIPTAPDLTTTLVLATAPTSTAAPIATSSPVAEPAGYWTGPINSAVPATIAGGKVLHDAHALQALLRRPETVIVDVSNAPVRPENLATGAPWLPVPHQAIPGSVWIPGVGLGEIPPAAGDFFRRQLAAATGNDPTRPIVIYCHQTCWLSWNAAKRAISYGYFNVYWFRDGIEGWKAAHLPTAVIEPRVAPES
jgi:PQQ-dependent catabolism-associated CXXCW motif protein